MWISYCIHLHLSDPKEGAISIYTCSTSYEVFPPTNTCKEAFRLPMALGSCHGVGLINYKLGTNTKLLYIVVFVSLCKLIQNKVPYGFDWGHYLFLSY